VTAGRDGDDAELLRTRMVAPDVVVQGGFDADRYPYEHLIVGKVRIRTSRLDLPVLLEAVERLANAGWELVTLTRIDDALTCAVLRRAALKTGDLPLSHDADRG
jgi:hypothetical protein